MWAIIIYFWILALDLHSFTWHTDWPSLVHLLCITLYLICRCKRFLELEGRLGSGRSAESWLIGGLCWLSGRVTNDSSGCPNKLTLGRLCSGGKSWSKTWQWAAWKGISPWARCWVGSWLLDMDYLLAQLSSPTIASSHLSSQGWPICRPRAQRISHSVLFEFFSVTF